METKVEPCAWCGDLPDKSCAEWPNCVDHSCGMQSFSDLHLMLWNTHQGRIRAAIEARERAAFEAGQKLTRGAAAFRWTFDEWKRDR